MNLKLNILSQEEMERVHEQTLKILEETGVAFRHKEALEIFKRNGAKVVNETVYFSRDMVEKALESCPKTYKWQARNAANSVTVGDGFLIQPNFGAIHVQDLDNGRRLGKLEDYSNIQKLSQASKVCNLAGAMPVSPSDVAENEKHLYMVYETIKNTDKPIVGQVSNEKQANEMLDMVEMSFGEKGFLQQNHCMAVGVNPLSPLAYAPETLETIITYAKRNQIVFILPCIMAGVTGPISLLGAVILQNVEILAALVLIQLINPGNPIAYSPASSAAYMKRASYVTGPPEMTLINSANIQLGLDYYNLPTRTMSGMTDSKMVDCQAGYESMQSLLMSMLAGSHIIVQAMGVLDGIMTTSYEKLIIDEELISRSLRICQGMDTSENASSIDVIKEVGINGSYLTHTNTFEHFRDFWLPTVSEWEPYGDWVSKGSEDVVVRANRRFKEILNNAPEMIIDSKLDIELKAYMQKVMNK